MTQVVEPKGPRLRRAWIALGLLLLATAGAILWVVDDSRLLCFSTGCLSMKSLATGQGELKSTFDSLRKDAKASLPEEDAFGEGGGGNYGDEGDAKLDEDVDLPSDNLPPGKQDHLDGLRQPEQVPHGDGGMEEEDYVELNKRTDWGQSKLLLLAGIQGTGHQVWQRAIAKACSGNQVTCVRLCAASSLRLFSLMNYAQYELALDNLDKELKEARRKHEANPNQRFIFFVNLFGSCNDQSSSMAFPIEEKYLDAAYNPDPRAIARMAELAGVDMRVLVMAEPSVRKIAEAWFSSYTFSPFAVTNFQILRTLQLAIESLFGNIRLLKPSFFAGYDLSAQKLMGPGAGVASKSLDEWTGLPGFASALEEFKDEPWVPASGPAEKPRHLQDADLQYLPRIEFVNEMFLSFLRTGTTRMVIPKTIIATTDAPRPRLLFFAGLEGTGHHLFTSLFTLLTKENPQFEAGCAIQRIMYWQNSQTSLGESTQSSVYADAKARLRAELKALSLDESKRNSTLIINLMDRGKTGCHEMVGEMSYPNFGGAFKTLQHPDMIVLAQEAEAAGIDLRIVLLTRDANKIMVSTTVHRHFGKRRELNNLEPVSHALFTQLQALDPAFILTCINFGARKPSWIATMARKLWLPELPKLVGEVMHSSSRHYTDKKEWVRRRRISTFNATTNLYLETCPAAG